MIMIMFLTFDSVEKANTALVQININMGLPKKGINAKTGEEVEGADTTSWAEIQQAYNQDLWYFEKPEEGYMTNVSNYEESEFSQDWIPV